MKIVFFGDSITDASRTYDAESYMAKSFGQGYVFLASAELMAKYPGKFEIINRGISGNRVVDLYQRIKCDVWNQQPDVLSILVGVNDVWHEINKQNGVDLVRYEKVYRMIIEDTKKALPNVKIILMEPYVLKGLATEVEFEKFKEVYKYAEIVKRLANEYDLTFVPLQEKFSSVAEKYGAEFYVKDGVHPGPAGAKVIADAWLDAFYKKVL